MRTQAEIIAQCEARMKELEIERERREQAEAIRLEKPSTKWPCETCKWRKRREPYEGSPWVCTEPLVVGFRVNHALGWDKEPDRFYPKLCGPEKALWQPIPVKLTFWQRIKSCLNNL